MILTLRQQGYTAGSVRVDIPLVQGQPELCHIILAGGNVARNAVRLTETLAGFTLVNSQYTNSTYNYRTTGVFFLGPGSPSSATARITYGSGFSGQYIYVQYYTIEGCIGYSNGGGSLTASATTSLRADTTQAERIWIASHYAGSSLSTIASPSTNRLGYSVYNPDTRGQSVAWWQGTGSSVTRGFVVSSAANHSMSWCRLIPTPTGPSFTRDGVAGADIGSVEGVPAADIAAVDGVSAVSEGGILMSNDPRYMRKAA